MSAPTWATDIAHDWSSVMTWSDPGVQLYAFASTGRVQSEGHRERCLAYLRDCISRAESQGDAADLRDLIAYVDAAPIEPNP